MKRILWLALIIVAVGTTAEAGSGRFRFRPRAQAPQSEPYQHQTYCVGWSTSSSHPVAIDPRPLIWVVDGAGDLKGSSTALTAANGVAGSPVEMAVFSWSHGYRRLYKDQTDTIHARAQGERLARAILERKTAEPGRRIVVAGHSAGCAVVLAACDILPVDTVDRVLLLAPSVSTSYDLRPTLWSAKEGIDVFCSKKDWVALGFVVRVVGTTDNGSRSAAGRYGFKPECALSDLESSRFRQHFWSPDLAWTGHTGGHHGVHAPTFIKTFLLPMMIGEKK